MEQQEQQQNVWRQEENVKGQAQQRRSRKRKQPIGQRPTEELNRSERLDQSEQPNRSEQPGRSEEQQQMISKCRFSAGRRGYGAKNWKRALLLVLATMLVTAPLTLLVNYFFFEDPVVRKLRAVEAVVDRYFLYDIDQGLLENAAAAGYLQGLEDDYAYYYDPDAYAQKQQSDQGQIVNFGITIAIHPDTGLLTVAYVHRNSPAKQAGVQVGDVLTAINGVQLAGKTQQECADLIAKEEGTQLTVDIQRDGEALQLSTTLFTYEEDCVIWRKIGQTGYIRITTFHDVTFGQFEQALQDLQQQHVTGLVFDLRNNLGGSVDAVCDVLDLLLPEGVLLRIQDKNGTITEAEYSDANGIDLPMAVLTNEYTASSAEIFCMNIRDFQQGRLIGTTTYGKGIIQTTYTLYDETAVKITTGQIVALHGNSYHGTGLQPDVEVEPDAVSQKYGVGVFCTDAQDVVLQTALQTLQ